jgi:GH15 family glucan-1,4-alpha-glucosidase
MAWVAIDRWVQLIAHAGLADDPAPWRALADQIHADVCANGYDEASGAFVQYYGASTLDASVLMLGLVGFLPPTDERLVRTIDAIAGELMVDGFVRRYATDEQADDEGVGVDGLPPGEGAFLLTTFWLIDCLLLLGRLDEAEQLFERMLGLCNDVGLLAEEFDPQSGRMLGNFPQAFSHVGLVNTAFNLAAARPGQADRVKARAEGATPPPPP